MIKNGFFDSRLKSRGGKRDENEMQIVAALIAIGATVIRLNAIDLLVGFRGKNFLFEVKASEGTMTSFEKEFFKFWEGERHVVRSEKHAMQIMELVPWD